ncbi:hypothetical protein BJ875DRAFT_441027 [Amylocarpus encephaloides]|uniref:Uncharacterized protein n=1 Tax=Amylocarpus encephaloides TaxID=45428 RepID=A0A9P8C5Y7_9HELO|nr:hypothetical protein BJ875DRAFT_441027 [Amylocarpus encephaloides]
MSTFPSHMLTSIEAIVEDPDASDGRAISVLNSASRNKQQTPSSRVPGVLEALRIRFSGGWQKSHEDGAKAVDWEVPPDETSAPRPTKRRKVGRPILKQGISTGQTPQVIIRNPIKRPRSTRGKFTKAPASKVAGEKRQSTRNDPVHIEHSSFETPVLLEDIPSQEASKGSEQPQGTRRSKSDPSTKSSIPKRIASPPLVVSDAEVRSTEVNGIKRRTRSSTQKNVQLAAPTNAGGVSNILDDPSPGNAVDSGASRASPNRSFASVQTNEGPEELSSDEGGTDEADIVGSVSSADTPDRAHSKPPTTSELYTISLNFDHLDGLISSAKQIGSRYSKGTEASNAIINVKAAKTGLAKEIIRHIQHLQSCYKALANINPTSNTAQPVARENISTALNKLKENVGRIIETKLKHKIIGNQGASKDSIKLLLIDLYFIVFPTWLECIKLGMKVYNEGGALASAMREISITEMCTLLDCYTNLASAAIAQSIQPTYKDVHKKGDNTHSPGFSLERPTKTVLCDIHKLQSKFRRELVAIKKQATNQKTQPLQPEGQHIIDIEWEENLREADARRTEQENHRLAENHRHEREMRKRNAYIHQRQREDFVKIKREAAEEDASFQKRFRKLHQYTEAAHYVVGDGVTKATADWDDDDPFADDYERVHVFPEHNKSQVGPKKPWSDEETLAFILCMMEGGDDKFGRAAEQLACSMEEVFTAAKDLQEANDRAHERGELNAPEDSWTYKVWPGS